MRLFFRSLSLRLGICLLLMAAGLFLLRDKYDPVIRALAQTQVKNTASELINDAVARQIRLGQIRYDRIVYFEKDLNGRITALKTNIGELNRLKTETLDLINDEVLAAEESSLGIPLGSLLLPELLAGKGPRIPIRILAIRNSDADFLSDFTEAGINQTRHRLNMEVRLDVTVLILGRTDAFTVTSQVVAAETVIVGQVPQTFLNTGG